MTAEQHQQVVRRLLDLGRNCAGGISPSSAGIEYTSLMVCFLLHNLSAAEALLRLGDSFGNEWFPVTVGYSIARTMFEADVNAHYISQSPKERARQYIGFGAILNKRQMDACREVEKSKDPSWREAMAFVWKSHWQSRQTAVSERFDAVIPQFTRRSKSGRPETFRNWSGMSLYEMAIKVDHCEAYKIFYAELSSFSHVDVHLADRFLECLPDGPVWSQRAKEGDVGKVFMFTASFLTCYLEFFGREFGVWSEGTVQNCWTLKN